MRRSFEGIGADWYYCARLFFIECKFCSAYGVEEHAACVGCVYGAEFEVYLHWGVAKVGACDPEVAVAVILEEVDVVG